MTRCRVCKCTELRACFPPCSWEPNEPDLCDLCAEVIRKLREWLIGAHQPSVKALINEARKPQGPGIRARRKAAGRPLLQEAAEWGRKFEAMGKS